MHYLVIAFRHEVGGWASGLPDFVGVTMRLEDVAKAIQRAVVAARSALEALKAIAARLPVPSNLDAVQRNYVWAPEDGIDWSKSVVRTVSWHLDDLTDKDPAQPPQKDNGRWPSRKRAAQKTFVYSGVTAMTATHASEPGQDAASIDLRQPTMVGSTASAVPNLQARPIRMPVP